MKLSMIPFFVTCWVTFASAQGPTRVQTLPTVKVVTSERYVFHASGIPVSTIRSITADADKFVTNLESLWNIRVADDLIPVAISVRISKHSFPHSYDNPDWLASGYSPQLNKIVIQVKDQFKFEPQAVASSLKMETVRYLLRSKGQTLPAMMDTGFALNFSRTFTSRDRYLAIFAFREYRDIANNPSLTGDLGPTADHNFQVLSFVLANWMWENWPQKSQVFIHETLKGSDSSDALYMAGFPTFNELLDEFDDQNRSNYGMTRLLFSFQSLMTLIALALLAWLINWIRHSLSTAKAGAPIEIMPPAAQDREMEQALKLLKQGTRAQPPIRNLSTPSPTTVDKPKDKIDKDLDAFFGQHVEPNKEPEAVEFAKADEVVILDEAPRRQPRSEPRPEPRPARNKLVPKVTVDLPTRQEKKRHVVPKKPTDDSLEIELDDFFGGVIPKSGPDKDPNP